jgi:tRNA(Arg) A34 adenosine deaminase TadA
MMTAEIVERLRLPAPAPKPLGLAFDGPTLWMASRETNRLYAINASAWTARDEGEAPGGPFGMAVVGDELRVVVGLGENQNDRYIYRFVPGHGFKSDRIECPDLTGAHVAFDGDVLFLSQASYRKILALNGEGAVTREIALDRVPVGMTIVDGNFYLVTTDEEFENVQLTKVDAHGEVPKITALASIPFDARGLTFDGSRFWTSHRDASEIVAFALPE